MRDALIGVSDKTWPACEAKDDGQTKHYLHNQCSYPVRRQRQRGRAGARSRPNEFYRKNQPTGLPTLVETSSRQIVGLQFCYVDFGSARSSPMILRSARSIADVGSRGFDRLPSGDHVVIVNTQIRPGPVSREEYPISAVGRTKSSIPVILFTQSSVFN
jgi:hypothetical protein